MERDEADGENRGWVEMADDTKSQFGDLERCMNCLFHG